MQRAQTPASCHPALESLVAYDVPGTRYAVRPSCPCLSARKIGVFRMHLLAYQAEQAQRAGIGALDTQRGPHQCFP